MTVVVHLAIAGQPQGKGRPRFARDTGRVYTPKATLIAEGEIRRAWEEAGHPRLPDEALHLDVRLGVVRPKGHFTTKGELSAAGLRAVFPANRKPDVDNALKLVMDALNSRAWRDDVQVVTARVSRHWARFPSVEIVASVLSAVQTAEAA